MTKTDLQKEILTHAHFFPITQDEFQSFEDLAIDCGSAELVIKEWRFYKVTDKMHKTPVNFFEWWGLNRPDMGVDDGSGEVVPEKKTEPLKRKKDRQGGLFGAGPWDDGRK